MNRAYSILEIKAVNDEDRVIEGIASTPTPDRVGDIVEPMGAVFKLPMPLLWQHRHEQPIGFVEFANPTKKGISFKARLATVLDAGALRDRIEEAWQSVKAQLVRGVSIGFRPLKDGIEYMDDGGIRFKSYEWLELSIVTIPANADATIDRIKSIDAAILAASGHRERGVVRLTPPGASGSINVKPKPPEGNTMKTSEQLTAFEAKRQAISDRMTEIMNKAADAGSTLDDAESEEYDTLESEIKAVDVHLKRLRALEKVSASKAVPVTQPQGQDPGPASGPVISVTDRLPPGIEFARYVKCLAAARGDVMRAYEIAKANYPDQPRIQRVLKAAVAGGTTTDTTWAAPLVDYTQFAGDFVEFLRPMTILGKFGTAGIPSLRRIPFNVQIPRQTSGGNGYWVGEGKPKPLTKFDFDRIQMRWAKVAGISVLTDELVRFSNPSADMLVRNALAEALVARLDTDFVDPTKAAVTDVSPASITNGVTPITASGADAAAVRADVQDVFAQFIAANMSPTTGVWIMSAVTALGLSMMQNALGQPEFPGMTLMGGTLYGMPVIVSEYIPTDTAGRIVILVNADDVYLSDDGQVVVDASREASLQMLDDPTNASADGTATTMVSMFQTNSVAVRAERWINWQKRRTTAASYISGVAYAA